jgi:hypothetical protein
MFRIILASLTFYLHHFLKRPEKTKLSIKGVMDFPKHHLNLSIKESSSNSYTEFVLANTNHEREKKTHQRRIIFVFISYLIFLFAFERQYLGAHIAFLLILAILIIRLLGLVDKEVLKVVKDFGIEKSVVFAFNRNRQIFIPSNNIYKVVINEVIYFVSKNNCHKKFSR